jgi:hypothetical protein
MLAEDGLVAALRSGVAGSAVAVTLVDEGGGRPPSVLEAASSSPSSSATT